MMVNQKNSLCQNKKQDPKNKIKNLAQEFILHRAKIGNSPQTTALTPDSRLPTPSLWTVDCGPWTGFNKSFIEAVRIY